MASSALTVFPKSGRENHQNRENLQTADEHQRRAEPFDARRQHRPAHRGANLDTERGAYVADGTQHNGDGVGVVDAGLDDDERRDEAQHQVDGQECQQRDALLLRNARAVDVHRQHGVGVENLFELVANDFYNHQAANALKTAARAARTGAEKHAGGQHHPGDVGPLGGVVVEQACGGDERHDLEYAATKGFFHVVAVVKHQLNHDEKREGQHHEKVEFKLGVLPHRFQAAPQGGGIEQREIGTREETKQCGDIFDGGRAKELGAVVVGGKSARGRAAHSIVETVEPAHAKGHERQYASEGEQEVDGPNPLGAGAQSWMELRADGACSFGRKHFHRAAHKRRQDGGGEEHDAQTANPLRHAAPKEQAVGQRVDIVQDGGACSGEPRHGFEIGVGEARNVATDDKRQRTKKAEDDPRKRHHEVGVAAAHSVVGVTPEIAQHDAREQREHNADGKRHFVVFAKTNGHGEAGQHDGYFDEQQRAEDFKNGVAMNHLLNRFSIFFR